MAMSMSIACLLVVGTAGRKTRPKEQCLCS
jgi:hypothetical protein